MTDKNPDARLGGQTLPAARSHPVDPATHEGRQLADDHGQPIPRGGSPLGDSLEYSRHAVR